MQDMHRVMINKQENWSSRKACLEHLACGSIVWGTPSLDALSEWPFLKEDQPLS